MPDCANAPPEVCGFVIAYFGERFGVSPVRWQGLQFLVSGELVSVLAAGALPAWALDSEAAGLRVARLLTTVVKPTTYGLRWLGSAVSRCRVELTIDEWRRVLAGETPALGTPGLNRGYAALCLNGEVLGCGFFDGERMRNQIPAPLSRELARILAQGAGQV